jgi:predicted TPR repeat methyltransferase
MDDAEIQVQRDALLPHRPAPGARAPTSVQEIYGYDYAAIYPSLYVDKWPKKHERNARHLTRILEGLNVPMPRWLDLGCGQAWHFSVFSGHARMLGIDLSEAQLVRARRSAPDATFVCKDMAELKFPRATFDLVTNFWAAYGYLGSREKILRLFRSAVDWVSSGGALYIEVLLGERAVRFNQSGFAKHTGCIVTPRTADLCEWEFEDAGGIHGMTSPTLQDFLDVISPSFAGVEVRHDGPFMIDLIATGRK